MLPGFSRARSQATGREQQIDAGEFYRRLLQAGYSEQAAEQAQLATGTTEASQQPDDRSEQPMAFSAMTLVDSATATAQGVNDAARPNDMSDQAALQEPEQSTAGLGSSDRVEILQPLAAAPAAREHPADDGIQPAVLGPMHAYGIPPHNIGFQMLRKAGWCEGTGLGAEGQGRQMPLQQSKQKGRQGLGAAEAAAAAAAVAAAARHQQQQAGPAQQPVTKRQKQGKAARQPLPEDNETFDTKVKRHRQVMQAEADEAAGKAIQRYIHRAFRDMTGEQTSDDNPLLRRNKLTATNPLL